MGVKWTPGFPLLIRPHTDGVAVRTFHSAAFWRDENCTRLGLAPPSCRRARDPAGRFGAQRKMRNHRQRREKNSEGLPLRVPRKGPPSTSHPAYQQTHEATTPPGLASPLSPPAFSVTLSSFFSFEAFNPPQELSPALFWRRPPFAIPAPVSSFTYLFPPRFTVPPCSPTCSEGGLSSPTRSAMASRPN